MSCQTVSPLDNPSRDSYPRQMDTMPPFTLLALPAQPLRTPAPTGLRATATPEPTSL